MFGGSMFAPIPQPQTGMTAGLEAASSTQNILSNILSGQQKQQEIGMQQQELPYLIQAHQDAHTQAQTLLPQIEKQYEAENGQKMNDLDRAKAYNKIYYAQINQQLNAMKQSGAIGNAPPPQGTPGFPAPINPQDTVMQSIPRTAPMQQTALPPLPNVPSIPAINPMAAAQSALTPAQPPISAGLSAPQVPSAGNVQQQIAQALLAKPTTPPPPQVTQPTQQAGGYQGYQPTTRLGSNERVIIPAIPGQGWKDIYQGSKDVGGNEIKAIVETPLANGDIQRSWPSGQVTVATRGENPAIEQKMAELKATSANKLADKSLADMELSNFYAGNMSKVQDILQKHNQGTGLVGSVANRMPWLQTGYQGEFKSAAQPLVAPLAHEMMARVSNMGVNLAQSAKPDMGASIQSNLGRVKEMARQANATFDKAKADYERITGQASPYQKDPFLEKMATLADPNRTQVVGPGNTVVSIPKVNLQDFLKDHRDHLVVAGQ